MRVCGQKLVKFCTLTHAAKLVVRINTIFIKLRRSHDGFLTSVFYVCPSLYLVTFDNPIVGSIM